MTSETSIPEYDEQRSIALERIARELSAMGAETHAQRRAKRVLPWVASVGIHLGAIALALLITWTVTRAPEKDESILIVADFNALNYAPVIGMQSTPTQAAGPMVKEMVEPLPTGPTLSDQRAGLESDSLADITSSLGLASESGGSALSQFAPRAGQSSVTFAGVSGSNARRIVYVMDATGTMISSNYIVIDELERSLQQLSPKQSFTIIFFQRNEAIELPPGGKLIAATPEAKSKAVQWIKTIIPQGSTNPLVAIEKALTLKPDVVFLLSTGITGYGQFEIDQQDLMAKLDELNPKNPSTGRRGAQIKCIQFLDPDRLDTMEKIATEHGGPNGYRFLSRKELGLGE